MSNSGFKIFDDFEEWYVIESCCTEFIYLKDYDGNNYYLPNQKECDECMKRDPDEYVIIEEIKPNKNTGQLICKGMTYIHSVVWNNNDNISKSKHLMFLLDKSSIDEYKDHELYPLLEKSVNRCKLVNGNKLLEINSYRAYSDILDYSEIELLMQYTNRAYERNQFIIADKQVISLLATMKIEHRLLMKLIDIMNAMLK